MLHTNVSRRARPARATAGALTLCLLISLVACGGGDEGEADAASNGVAPTTTSAPPRSTTVATAGAPSTTADTATTAAPASSVVIDAVTGKPVVTSSATTTTVPGPPVYPLTGVPLDDPALAARPALVVKIDNAPAARPQTGFNAADIVYEEIVNDNLTRFAMVFHSRDSDPVGPVRSGRLQDIDLFGSLQHPLFSWSGGNATVTRAIRDSDLVDIGPSRAAVYFRSGERRAPHNLYSNTSALWSQTPPDWRMPIQQFAYRSDGESPSGTASAGVDLSLDAVDVRWDWDPAQGLYLRTMEGGRHMDRAGGQVSTNNVVVLVVEYLPGISGSPDARTLGHGEAHVFTGGTYIHGTWTRVHRLEPFQLTADDGSTIELTPGRTFIELPRPGNTLPFGPRV